MKKGEGKFTYFILILFTVFFSLLAIASFRIEKDVNTGFCYICIAFAIFSISHLYLPDYMREDKNEDEDDGKDNEEKED